MSVEPATERGSRSRPVPRSFGPSQPTLKFDLRQFRGQPDPRLSMLHGGKCHCATGGPKDTRDYLLYDAEMARTLVVSVTPKTSPAIDPSDSNAWCWPITFGADGARRDPPSRTCRPAWTWPEQRRQGASGRRPAKTTAIPTPPGGARPAARNQAS